MAPVGLDPNDPVVQAIQGQLNTLGTLATVVAQEVSNGVSTGPGGLIVRLASMQQAIIAAIHAAPPGGGLTADQARLLQEAHDAILRIEQALRSA